MSSFDPPLQHGSIEVIMGCMYSGKTEELIRQLRRAQYAKFRFQVFKPLIDNRYSVDKVASHNQTTFPSICVENSEDIYSKLDHRCELVAIDEAQFFDDGVITVATKIAGAGKRVVVAGLDTDWKGEPFGPMPRLACIADAVTKLYAICSVCGLPATKTQKLIANESSIQVGSTEAYEARCRKHFDPDLPRRLAAYSQKPEPRPL